MGGWGVVWCGRATATAMGYLPRTSDATTKTSGGSSSPAARPNEQSTRRAFANCLDAYCREHPDQLTLVDELEAPPRRSARRHGEGTASV